MSTFEVKVVEIKSIEPIPDADAIELAVVGDYRSVVKKGEYSPGMYAVYIPEASLIPADLLEKIGLTGKLAGSDKNRVKAIRLRGCLSQGILYPVHCTNPFAHGGKGQHEIELMNGSRSVVLGDDVAEDLGITKWSPPIPASMSGEVYNAGQHITYDYDIENFKWHPDVLVDGEEVQFTEKLHGTFCQLIHIPMSIAHDSNAMHKDHLRVTGHGYDCYFALANKRLGGQGLCFRWGDPERYNVYQRAVFEHLPRIADTIAQCQLVPQDRPVMIMGEVFGDGIQDLHYGMKNTFSFRIFDIRFGYRADGYFVDDSHLDSLCALFNIPRVPVVYRGPFSKEIMLQYTHHTKSKLDENQLSEGIVMKPTTERVDPSMGRVVLKSINEDYLMRKNKNATEYQ